MTPLEPSLENELHPFFTRWSRHLEALALLLGGVEGNGGQAQVAQQGRQPPRGAHRVHKHQRAPRVPHLRRKV